jgi:hypothetical protein
VAFADVSDSRPDCALGTDALLKSSAAFLVPNVAAKNAATNVVDLKKRSITASLDKSVASAFLSPFVVKRTRGSKHTAA